MRKIAWLVGLGILASGCSCAHNPTTPDDQGVGGDGSVACVDGLVSLQITPADQTVQLDGISAAPIAFVVTGTFADGHSSSLDVTQLAWQVTRGDATSPGTISGGVLSPNPKA